MWQVLVEPFVLYGFMQRALAGATILAVSAAPIGVFLMFRRMSLAGDAMAHAILPGAAAGFLVSGLALLPMTIGGFVAGLVVALLAGLVSRLTAQREDTSLAAFYLISLALGVLLVSLRGSSVDLMHVLFGSVLALNNDALILIGGVASVSLVGLALIWRPLFAECLDPSFLGSVSRAGQPVHLAFLALVVLNLVGGFHALGTLLAVGLMMLPAATARFFARDLTALVTLATLVAALSGVAGLLVSYHLGAPSGPAIILVAGCAYALAVLFGPVGGLIGRLVPRRHLEA
jgi:zinc/manganese transport system permease protein